MSALTTEMRSRLHFRAIVPEALAQEQVDALTVVLTPAAPVGAARLDALRSALDRVVDRGVPFLVLDLRHTREEVPGLDQTLRRVAASLEWRRGGLALVGGPGGLPSFPAAARFPTRAEALAGVRGRLTPAHSIERAPRPRLPRRPSARRRIPA